MGCITLTQEITERNNSDMNWIFFLFSFWTDHELDFQRRQRSDEEDRRNCYMPRRNKLLRYKSFKDFLIIFTKKERFSNNLLLILCFKSFGF